MGRHIKTRYPTEPKYNKYVKEYSFLSFAKKIGDKYSKKLIDAAKTTSKRDLIGNKIADKITSSGKTKSKEKGDERWEICIPPKKKDSKKDTR